MKKYSPLIVLLILLAHAVNGTAQKTSNVVASQEGKTIVITYDLDENAAITITATANNGRTPLQINALSGDIGKSVKAGKQKRIVWNVLDDYGDRFMYNDVVFTIKATPGRKTFILAEGAYSPVGQWGAGLMIGQVRQWGWFVKARSNYMFHGTEGTAKGDGFVEKFNCTPFYSGEKASAELIIDGGAVVRMGCPLYAYLGAGFGMRQAYWQTTDEKWVKYADNSVIGASVDIGLMGCIKGFTISFGANTINFKYVEFELGLGWMF